MDDVLLKVDQALTRALDEDQVLARRIRAWKLRLTGHTHVQIAEDLDVAVGTVHRDIRWCHENLPEAFETAQDFRHMSLLRLEEMYRCLGPARENGNDTAIKATATLMDLQAKLLGAYAPVKVDATTRQVTPELLERVEAERVRQTELENALRAGETGTQSILDGPGGAGPLVSTDRQGGRRSGDLED